MKTSIARKIAMALSGLFLIIFLLQHLTINSLSVVSKESFNATSHFMGTNGLVQLVFQPILIFGVVFHLIMGMILEYKNSQARNIKYVKNNAAANSTWMSRNMIYSGIMVLLFLGLHFYDFWVPEITTKYIEGDMSGLTANGEFRYFEELQHKFLDPVRTGLYVLAFIFLMLHLLHGFQSSFQSMGWRHPKYTPIIKKLGIAYAVLVPLGFAVIAVYHYVIQL
ncbi:MAG: succinate dehydrogenase cytochrome b subunit [Crocinitomicaceae bacterium]